jgi:aspartyl-tRNA(Asn)/glutamyl-tRNA(Gln) amidotransferase subunit C
MQLTVDDVRKVASLARLKVSDAEVTSLLGDLTAILDYVGRLSEVDTTDVEPMVHAIELHNVLRSDELVASLPRTAALGNAPRSDGECFLVPAIIEGD